MDNAAPPSGVTDAHVALSPQSLAARIDALEGRIDELAYGTQGPVSPGAAVVTKEQIKGRIQHLSDLIQEHRELNGQPRLGEPELAASVRDTMGSFALPFGGTALDQLESAIARYEDSVGRSRTDRLIVDALDELLGPAPNGA